MLTTMAVRLVAPRALRWHNSIPICSMVSLLAALAIGELFAG